MNRTLGLVITVVVLMFAALATITLTTDYFTTLNIDTSQEATETECDIICSQIEEGTLQVEAAVETHPQCVEQCDLEMSEDELAEDILEEYGDVLTD